MWTVKELERHRCRAIQALFAKKGDNQNKTLVRKFAEAYIAISNNKLKQTWNNGLPLLNRLLWANIETLPKKLLEKLLLRYTANDYLLRADFDKLGRVYALNTKRRKPVNLDRQLIVLGNTTVHNSFHYEVLSFARAAKRKVLTKRFEKRLIQIDKLMSENMVS